MASACTVHVGNSPSPWRKCFEPPQLLKRLPAHVFHTGGASSSKRISEASTQGAHVASESSKWRVRLTPIANRYADLLARSKRSYDRATGKHRRANLGDLHSTHAIYGLKESRCSRGQWARRYTQALDRWRKQGRSSTRVESRGSSKARHGALNSEKRP